MKTGPFFRIFLILFCMIPVMTVGQVQCENDSTGLIPLTDLGTGFYEGIQGGLYPGGLNLVTGKHKNNGIKLAKSLKPLDSLGNINNTEGEILFLGFGASLASNIFNAYIDSIKTTEYVGMNNCLTVKGLCFGGKDLTLMADSTSNYWEAVRSKMESRGDTYEQVQVAWIMQHSETDTTDDFGLYFDSMMDKWQTFVTTLKDTFPNLKMLYISGLHYCGYMDPMHENFEGFQEPHTYWGNLVIKELIKRQMMNDPALRYSEPGAQAPWLAWAPYYWTDGSNPRTYDGLSWSCDQFRDDPTGGGYHLVDTSTALGVEANMLWNFLKTDPVASIWYNEGALWAGCPDDTVRRSIQEPGVALQVYPNPAHEQIIISIPQYFSVTGDIRILDHTGRCVFKVNYSSHIEQITLSLPSGVYEVLVTDPHYRQSTRLIIQ